MDGYLYREEPGIGEDAPNLVLLHGTGGDETQLLRAGRQILPDGRLLAPRGDVSEGGMLRFFRRLGEGVYDMDDLRIRTDRLAAFVRQRVAGRGGPVLGLGYSNGANILASVLMRHPDLFRGAVLMHPLIPFQPAETPDLAKIHVLITAGRRDPIGEAHLTERLANWLRTQGAAVQVFWHEGGHEVRPMEFETAQAFLTGFEAGQVPVKSLG